MPSTTQDIRARLSRVALALAFAALATACQTTTPKTAPEPAVSALIVRNPGRFDVNLYAVGSEGAKPVWLGTVAAATTRSIALTARALQPNNTLVIQARAVGSSRSWTSAAVSLTTIKVTDVEIIMY